MKKLFKSRIFLVIVTAIICTTISVGATALYNSSEVGFTPTDTNWNVNNLQDAVNDLYGKTKNPIDDIVILSSGKYTTTKNYSKAYVIVTRLNSPWFKINGETISPIKTGSNANYVMNVYEIDDISANENWTMAGTTQIFFIN